MPWNVWQCTWPCTTKHNLAQNVGRTTVQRPCFPLIIKLKSRGWSKYVAWLVKLWEKRNKTLSNCFKFLTSVLHMIGDSLSSKYLLCVSMTAGIRATCFSSNCHRKTARWWCWEGQRATDNKQTNKTSVSYFPSSLSVFKAKLSWCFKYVPSFVE